MEPMGVSPLLPSLPPAPQAFVQFLSWAFPGDHKGIRRMGPRVIPESLHSVNPGQTSLS